VSNNDNLLIVYGTAAQLTNQGISFAAGDGFGNLNIADPPFSYNFTTDFGGVGTGTFFATLAHARNGPRGPRLPAPRRRGGAGAWSPGALIASPHFPLDDEKRPACRGVFSFG